MADVDHPHRASFFNAVRVFLQELMETAYKPAI